MKNKIRFISLLIAFFVGCNLASAQNLIPAPKEIKYLSDKAVRLKSVDIKITPKDGAPAEQYTLKTKGGKGFL